MNESPARVGAGVIVTARVGSATLSRAELDGALQRRAERDICSTHSRLIAGVKLAVLHRGHITTPAVDSHHAFRRNSEESSTVVQQYASVRLKKMIAHASSPVVDGSKRCMIKKARHGIVPMRVRQARTGR